MHKIDLENKERMSIIQEKLSKLEGWKEAVEHFYKFRKSQIDPIILIILLIIIIIIIVLLQKGG